MSIDQPFSFNRIYKGPPVEGIVFTSSVDLNNYLTSPVRYAGQKVSLVEGGEVTEYVLNATEDAWIEGGGAKQAAKGAISTGLLMGGTLGVASSTEFTVADGKGFIVDTYADPDNPVITEVEWTSLGNITDTEIANGELTFIAIDVTGSVVQSSTEFSRAQLKTLIYLGYTVHADLINITGVTDIAIPVTNPANLTYDLARSVGPFKIDPITLRGSVTDLSITSDAGDIFKYGANFKIDPKDASAFSVAALDSSVPSTAIQVYKDGVGGFTFNPITQIDPSVYDDGTGTPAVVGANNWSVKTVYLAPNIGKLYVALGTVEYSTLNQAIERFSAEQLSLPDTAEQTLLLGWIFAKGNAVDFNSPDVTTKILQSDKFGNTTGGGATSVVSNVTVTAENNLEIEDSEGTNIYRADDTYWFIEDFKENDELVITSASGNLPITMDLATPLQGRRSGIATLGVSIAPGDDFGIDNITVPTYSDVTKMEVLVEITGSAVFDSVLYDGVTEVARKQVTNGKFSHIFNSSFTTVNQRFEYVGGGAPGDTIKFDRIRFTDQAFDTGETVVTNEISLSGNNGEANAGFSGNIPYNGTGQGWDSTNREYTVQFNNSTVHITAWALLNSSFPSLGMSLFVNGVQVGYVGNSTSSTSNTGGTLVINEDGFGSLSKLKKGDKISVRVNQSGNFRNNAGDERFHYLNIVETAKADNVVIEGDTLPSLTETKVLSADVTTNTTVSDLTFTDLEVGAKYFVSGVIYTHVNLGGANAPNLYVTHTNGSTTVSRTDSRTSASNEQVISHGVSYSFVASDSTLTFNTSNASSKSKLVGTNNRQRTFIQLTKERTNAIVQVTASGKENVYSARVQNNGTASVLSESSPFIKSVNRDTTGTVTVEFFDGFFAEYPSVSATSIEATAHNISITVLSANSITLHRRDMSNTLSDGDFSITVQRQGPDYRDPQTIFIGEASPERYSTTEIDTGKVWIDGKPIKRKVVVISSDITGNTTITNIGANLNLLNGFKLNGFVYLNFFNAEGSSSNRARIFYNPSTGDISTNVVNETINPQALILDYTE